MLNRHRKNVYHSGMTTVEPEFSFRPVLFPLHLKPGRSLVAVTERIDCDIVYSAYLQGIFPWYEEDRGEPVCWWSPDPRFVLFPEELHVPSRLRRFMKHSPFRYTMNRDFEQVISRCAGIVRPGQTGTWIGPAMIDVYCRLHEIGVAHSVEAWHGDTLAGGFYGVSIGQVFFGESMFSAEPDSAKSAFVRFVLAFRQCGGMLIDSQVYTDNIARFGGRNISRDSFLQMEKKLLGRSLLSPLPVTFEQLKLL